MTEDSKTEEDIIKNTTVFYCKLSDGAKLCGGGKEYCDLNSDIKWGGCVKNDSKAKKPSTACDCKPIKDIPYTIIKYFKEFTEYPDKVTIPKDKKCWGAKEGRKKSAKMMEGKVSDIMEKLSNEVKHSGYDGEYDHEDKRRVVRNRILYSIPYTGKWWGNFRHKATEARRRNLQKLKGGAVQGKKVRVVKKRHHQRKLQASAVGVESNLGNFVGSAVVAGKKDGASSENDKREVHANTYEVNSISPDGLNKVTRQVQDVVSTTVSSAEAHSTEVKAVGNKLVAQKS
jgi:hypothetical protein